GRFYDLQHLVRWYREPSALLEKSGHRKMSTNRGEHSMAEQTSMRLELDDIQSGVLRPRPTPFAAAYILLRIDDRQVGRELMRRASTLVASTVNPTSPAGDAWISVALTFQGLKALGVPQASLDSFAPEFQEGMAARARQLGDIGESAPEYWDKPLGT